MLPSLSSWAAVHCGLLVLTQQFLAANTQITTDLFQKFVCYARFSAASYAYSCPNPPYGATVANFFNVASTDTQGGTSDIQDSIINFTSQLTAYNSVGVSGCDGRQVHTGFLEAWNSVSSEAIAAINIQLTSHSNDGVPQMIHTSDGYRHHSTEFWENDTAVASTTVQCSGQEPLDCNNTEPGLGLGPSLIGINFAHLTYSGISVGNPLDGGRSQCHGS